MPGIVDVTSHGWTTVGPPMSVEPTEISGGIKYILKEKAAIIFLGFIPVCACVLFVALRYINNGRGFCFADENKRKEEANDADEIFYEQEKLLPITSVIPDVYITGKDGTTTKVSNKKRSMAEDELRASFRNKQHMPRTLGDIPESHMSVEVEMNSYHGSYQNQGSLSTNGYQRLGPASITSTNTTSGSSSGSSSDEGGSVVSERTFRREVTGGKSPTPSRKSNRSNKGLHLKKQNIRGQLLLDQEITGEDVCPGNIQVRVSYNVATWDLTVGIVKADFPELLYENSDQITWRVHIAILPFKKHKFRTKFRKTCTPTFQEEFVVPNIAEQVLNSVATQLSVRYRVYGRIGKTGEQEIGEVEVGLHTLRSQPNYVLDTWKPLKLVSNPKEQQKTERRAEKRGFRSKRSRSPTGSVTTTYTV